MATIATLTVDLHANTARFLSELEKAQARTKDFGASLRSSLGSLAAGIAVGAVAAFTKQIGDAAEKTLQLSDRLKISTGDLQALQYAAEQSGVSFESLSGGVSKLYRALDQARQGGAGAAEAFDRLGINVQAFASQSLSQQLEQLATKFAGITDPVRATSLAIDLFGKSGAELVPFLQQGPDAIGELTARFKALGLELDRGALENLDKAADSLDDLARVAKKAAAEALAPLADTLKSLADIAGAAARAIGPLLSGVFDVFRGTVEAAGAALAYLLEGIALAGSVLPGVGDKFKGAAEFLDELSNAYARAADRSYRAALGFDAAKKAATDAARQPRLGSRGNPNELPEVTVTYSFGREAEKAKRAYEEQTRRIADARKKALDEFTSQTPRDIFAKGGDGGGAGGFLDEFTKKIEGVKPALADLEAFNKRTTDLIEKAWLEKADAINESFIDRISQLRGSFKSLIFDLVRIVVQSKLKETLAEIFGNGGVFGKGGFFGALTSFVGGLFGGGRASGGPVKAGKIYRVNENTPNSEYFAPSSDGFIFPDRGMQTAGGLVYAPTISIDASGADAERVLAVVPPMIEAATRRSQQQMLDALRRNRLPVPR